MAVKAGALQTLHRIHQQISDLRDRRQRGPRRVRAGQQTVANLEQKLEQVKQQSQQAKMASDQKQLDLKSIEDKILDWKGRLNSCSSNKEYQVLLEQIAAAEMAGSVLSDEILELLEKIDDLATEIATARTNVESAAAGLARAQEQVANEAEQIAADLDRLENELRVAEDALPVAFRADYDRVVHAKGVDGLTVATDACCSGCFQQLTANLQNSLALGRPIFCPSCGRLLYNAEAGE